MTSDEKLESLGYSLAKTLSRGATYQPVVIDGATAYVSGCLPFDGDKNLVSKGKVPSQVSLEDARKAAALCAPNVLRLVRQEVGSLDRVERILKLTGFVNIDPDFMEQHLVINGASQEWLKGIRGLAVARPPAWGEDGIVNKHFRKQTFSVVNLNFPR